MTQAQVRAIRDKKDERGRRRGFVDPLVLAAATRAERKPSRLAAIAAKAEATRLAEEAKTHREIETRRSLLRAAQVARRMGYAVRASKGRAGHVSSYYVARDNGGAVRISDHAIPATAQREAMAEAHGRSWGYGGYHGQEIIIDRPRSETWLRRSIILALAGRL